MEAATADATSVAMVDGEAERAATEVCRGSYLAVVAADGDDGN